MGKIRIKLKPDGSIEVETKDIKGKKCLEYANILTQLADLKVDKMEMTQEYYENDYLKLDESQNLSDNK